MISPVTTDKRRDARQVERNSKGKRKSQVQLSSGSSALEARSKWDVQLIAHCFRYYIVYGWMDGCIYIYNVYIYIININTYIYI